LSLTDRHDRRIGYLRLSLTKACQMRCDYCRPTKLGNPDGENDLSVEEIRRLVSHLVERHGLRKVRLTGGDPTARRDHVSVIKTLAQIDGLDDLAMTTNGLTLAGWAEAYAQAGLRRVNVSVDSLDPERFARITGVDGLQRVLSGIEAAVQAGLDPVRLNAVVTRGANDDELPGLVSYAAERGLEMRFIELMPMGPLAERWAERYVTVAEMRRKLEPHFTDWRVLPQGSDSASRFQLRTPGGRVATVGFISPMSNHFCGSCNRLRITASGELYPCLMDEPAGSLMSAIRPSFDAQALDELLRSGLEGKRPKHPVQGFVTMTHIGG
jgi:cyclic pyranopterin phosphate synthase